MLVDENGVAISNLWLKGEVFSSPILIGRSLVVGCRDNLLYCFELLY